MAQSQATSTAGKGSKCAGRQRKAASDNHDDTLITSAERRKRKGSAEALAPPAKRSSSKDLRLVAELSDADPAQQNSEGSPREEAQQAVEQKTPSRREGRAASGTQNLAGRTAAQSPRAGQGVQSKSVLNSILSPVLTLFHGGKEDKRTDGSTVILEDGRKAHVGIHHCDGGPEPRRHDMPIEQVEGMPLPEVEGTRRRGGSAIDGAAAKQAEGEDPGSSTTDGESDTCVDEGVLCQSECSDRSVEEGGAEAKYEDEEYNEECIDFDPYAFIKNLPPLKQVVPRWRTCLLPRQTRRFKRKTLVLDLDETLVHSTLDSCTEPDFSFPVAFNGREHRVHVRRRPHLQAFLERCAELFEVVVFTASQKVYAEQLLNVLDPSRTLIRHRVFRDSCVFVEGNYLKDLSILGRDLAHTVIVDNSPQAFGYQLPNGIPIESWYDDEEDHELLDLLPFLESLVDVEDVRPAILAAYKLHQLVESAPLYPS